MAKEEDKKIDPLANGTDIGTGDSKPEEKKEDVKPKIDKKDKKAGETVEVSKDVLEKLLERLDVLEEAADKGRFERVSALRNQNNKLVKKVNLSAYQGRVVIGWKSVRDDVFFDREGKLHEDQVVALYFHDGKKDKDGKLIPEAEISIQSFARLTKKHECEVLSESKDQNGNIALTVQDKEGRKIDIGLDFINAS